ncbi:MAG: DNA polymerase III subunit delta [Chlorobi bacterium]|nr:DNA polymerase III subunit delta [Chlorobiota bacterium]
MFSIINKALEQRKPIYILTGDEDFLIRQFINSVKELVPPNERQFNLVVLTAGEISGQEAVYQARTLPMFGKNKVIIVYSANKWQEKDWQAILRYAANPSKHSILTIEATTELKKKNKALSKFEKDFNKFGILVKLNKPSHSRDFIALLMDYCTNRGITIDKEGLETLAELSNRSLESAVNEIEKLPLSYPEKKQFTQNDILYIIGIDKEHNIFELIDALAYRKPDKLARVGRNLAMQRDANLFELISIMYRIISYADLGRQYASSNRKQTEQKLISAFKCSLWSARQATAIMKNYTEQEVNAILELLYQYNKKAVGIRSGLSMPQELIEEFTLELSVIAHRLVKI